MKKYPVVRANDRMAMDGFAFLEKQLEKVDDKILEPLNATLWPRDMPVKTGGGFVENVASIDVNYASSGNGEDSLIWDATNDIPVIQADFGKSIARVFNFSQYARIPYIDKQKFKNISLNIEDFLNKGVHLLFDKLCDQNVYTGFQKVNSTGLLNNANVTAVAVDPHTPSGTDTKWEEKDADEILADINKALTAVWEDNEMSEDALPNHILVPVEQFGAIVSRKVGVTGDKSILTYIEENNIVAKQGKDLVISPCKFCKGIFIKILPRLKSIRFNIRNTKLRISRNFFNYFLYYFFDYLFFRSFFLSLCRLTF